MLCCSACSSQLPSSQHDLYKGSGAPLPIAASHLDHRSHMEQIPHWNTRLWTGESFNHCFRVLTPRNRTIQINTGKKKRDVYVLKQHSCLLIDRVKVCTLIWQQANSAWGGDWSRNWAVLRGTAFHWGWIKTTLISCHHANCYCYVALFTPWTCLWAHSGQQWRGTAGWSCWLKAVKVSRVYKIPGSAKGISRQFPRSNHHYGISYSTHSILLSWRH